MQKLHSTVIKQIYLTASKMHIPYTHTKLGCSCIFQKEGGLRNMFGKNNFQLTRLLRLFEIKACLYV